MKHSLLRMRQPFTFGLLAMLATLAYSQDSPKPVPWKLEVGIVTDPVVVDVDCLPDYLKAITDRGLEGRKIFMQLFQVGCVKSIEKVVLAFSSEKKTFTLGDKVVSMRHVAITSQGVDLLQKDFGKYADRLERSSRYQIEDNSSDETLKVGWIADQGFMTSNREELIRLFGLKTAAPAPAPPSNSSAGKISNQ
jgi:hypothetical protein